MQYNIKVILHHNGGSKLNSDEKKIFLKSYRKIVDKLRSLEEQKISIVVLASSAKAISYSDMPKGNKQSDISDIMVKLEEVNIKIADAEKNYIKQRTRIENAIVDVKDAIECDILRKRYIEFKSWNTIYEEIEYSARDTHRKHKKALSNINLA